MAEFLLGLLGNLVAAEIGEWLPRLSCYILNRALTKIPHELRERLSEEWHSVLSETPGSFNKLRCAIGLYSACPRIRYEFCFQDEPYRPISFHSVRLIDVTLSALGLLLLAPLFLVIAGLIRLTTRGHSLQRQPRVNQKGDVFVCYRFMTEVGLDEPKRDLTRVGFVLEKLGLEFLPMLYNVLVGNMSLIGARHVPYDWLVREREWAEEFLGPPTQMRPGIVQLRPSEVQEYLKQPFLNYFKALGRVCKIVLLSADKLESNRHRIL